MRDVSAETPAIARKNVVSNSSQRMIVSKVRFMPGARTAWHSHARGQTLHVTEGAALMGTRDGTVIEVRPGQPTPATAGLPGKKSSRRATAPGRARLG